MNSYEIFVKNPEDLSEVFEDIQKKKTPEKFDQEFLASLGMEKNSAILYISLFKRLGLIDEEGNPDPEYYPRYIASEEKARKVIGTLVEKSYRKVFTIRGDAHHLNKKNTRKLFRNLLDESKSETMVTLIADTFNALTEYAEWQSENEQEHMTMQYQNNGHDEQAESFDNTQDGFLKELMSDSTEHDYKSDDTLVLKEKNGHDDNEINIGTTEKTVTERKVSREQEDSREQDDSFPTSDSEVRQKDKQRIEENSELKVDKKIDQEAKKDGSFASPSFSDESNTSQSEFLKQALIRRAELLDKMERVEDAVNAYNDIISYSRKDEADIDENVVNAAFYKKALLLEQMEKYDEALSTYDRYIDRFE